MFTRAKIKHDASEREAETSICLKTSRFANFFFFASTDSRKKNFGSDRTSEIYDSTSIGMRTDDFVFMDREKNMTGVRHAMKNKPRVGPGKKTTSLF